SLASSRGTDAPPPRSPIPPRASAYASAPPRRPLPPSRSTHRRTGPSWWSSPSSIWPIRSAASGGGVTPAWSCCSQARPPLTRRALNSSRSEPPETGLQMHLHLFRQLAGNALDLYPDQLEVGISVRGHGRSPG